MWRSTKIVWAAGGPRPGSAASRSKQCAAHVCIHALLLRVTPSCHTATCLQLPAMQLPSAKQLPATCKPTCRNSATASTCCGCRSPIATASNCLPAASPLLSHCYIVICQAACRRLLLPAHKAHQTPTLAATACTCQSTTVSVLAASAWLTQKTSTEAGHAVDFTLVPFPSSNNNGISEARGLLLLTGGRHKDYLGVLASPIEINRDDSTIERQHKKRRAR